MMLRQPSGPASPAKGDVLAAWLQQHSRAGLQGRSLSEGQVVRLLSRAAPLGSSSTSRPSAKPLAAAFVVSAVLASWRRRWCRRCRVHRRAFTDAWRGALFRRDRLPGKALSLLPLMQDIYTNKILPLEQKISLSSFAQVPELTEAYFYAKPLVTVIGQYSTGKSSLISELLQQEYPGVRIGPQPTTDSFVAVMSGPSRQVVPGFALCADPSRPFGQLQRFGSTFLDRFQASLLPESEAPVLGQVCFIDTPGVLSGDKQRIDRNYDFEGAVGWFAENSDLVLVLFDPNKLDISDEFRRCLGALSRSERKVRFILNKADQLSTFELVRVYGALMWSLSKVISTPEMVHATVASFGRSQEEGSSGEAEELRKFLRTEEEDLRSEVANVPLDNTTRKVNDLVRRARLARSHALLIDHLAHRRGGFLNFGGRVTVRDILEDPQAMEEECEKVAAKHCFPVKDFLPPADLCTGFSKLGAGALKRIHVPLLMDVESALLGDIPHLMDQVAAEREVLRNSTTIPAADPPPVARSPEKAKAKGVRKDSEES